MSKAITVYIPHGGGPLPLLGDPSHADLVRFLGELPGDIERPDAIVVISAHWEEAVPTLTAAAAPPLIFDYYGFPPETYEYEYPAPGAPELATRAHALLGEAGIDARLDPKRGFDHGLFVPLMLMYPRADIPCIQLSLCANLDAETHLRVGRALAPLRDEKLLILGSGFSFHNMQALMSKRDDAPDARNLAFEDWLLDTCTDASLDEADRAARLADWTAAPHARFCHPREEHLLPLMVCYGVGGGPAGLAFRGPVARFTASAYRW